MAYDPATGQMVLFGGYRGTDTPGHVLGDTWVLEQHDLDTGFPAVQPAVPSQCLHGLRPGHRARWSCSEERDRGEQPPPG